MNLKPSLLVIFIVLTFQEFISGENICDEAIIINDPLGKRWTEYSLDDSATAIDDRQYSFKWIRFNSTVGPYIAGFFPGKNKCGTIRQIWIKDDPAEQFSSEILQACISNHINPCATLIGIQVYNCESFVIWKLMTEIPIKAGICLGSVFDITVHF
ncbi:DgyrCDS6280 [Dimorphilus gyrociliatus]|uniref:DgyrCDS6280 n=1 Tax=Dimorphilus gyrociliatus TaxID=2664684 RepID=A0A7I8VNC8_9ANNE|nr:DgyrCDS6280 [Dimorphilus gyrociliatus]